MTSTLFSYDFESGLGAFTATTTSGTGTWHTVTNPQLLAVSSDLNPFAVTLADTGEHLPAAGGSSVVWFGDNSTGTFIGHPYPSQSPKGGGSSSQAQTGRLTSPPISLSGVSKAQLEFDSWWEIEGTAAASYDLMQVWLSNDGGGAYTMLGQLNPAFAAQQPPDAAYSSGGPAAPPVWRHYAYDISAHAGETVQIQFRFNTVDTNYNAFRGFTIDNISVVGGTALPAPMISAVSPSSGTVNDLVTIQGANFQQGALFYLGSKQIPPSDITQFGANSMLFQVPLLAGGTYDVKVVNPDGQTFTLVNGFTYSTTPSPAISSISPATADVGASQDVTLSGSNFVSGATVSIGSTAAISVTVVSESQITATVPGLGAGTYNVKVTNPTGQSGTKFAAYTVSDTSMITVTAPNGGESWDAGSTRNITWSSSGTSVVDIDLYKGGSFVAALASGIEASGGAYAWTIPANMVAGSDYRVRISRPGGTVNDSSDEDFSISVPDIETTTTVSSSVNPSAQGQEVTFTATIAPAPSSGTVQFQIDGVSFGGPVAVSGGMATSIATSSLASGQHSIVATYSGSAPYMASSGSTTHTVNTAPVANAQSVTVAEDVAAAAITLTGTDADNDSLTFTVLTQPANGVLSGAAPSLTYTPNDNYNGPDSFTFLVNDGTASSEAATISISVTAVADAPQASSQSISTLEDSSVLIVLGATDADGDALSYSIVGPSKGSLVGVAPNLTYVPAADFFGADSFTFTVNDGTQESNMATVSIQVVAINDAPSAQARSVSLDEDIVTDIQLAGDDVDGDTLTYQVLSAPRHGTLTGTAPMLTYTPDANYFGPDAFTFEVNDGIVDSAAATISLSVGAVNDAPVANADAISTDEDTPARVTLTASDAERDELTFAIVNQPAHGTLTLSGAEALYSPTADYHGTDSFTFKANDGQVDSAVQSISVNVVSVNDAPIALAMSANTQEDAQLELTLAGHDADGDALTFTVEQQPVFGTLSGEPPNLIYTPSANYLGEDSFTFRAHDGELPSQPGVVSIAIGPVNDAPVAEALEVHTNEDTVVAVPLIATDIDGDALSYTVLTQPMHGELSGTAPLFTYTPSENFHGTDAFTFRVSDGQADSNVARVAVVTESVDDVPVATPQRVSLPEDVASELRLHGSDVEGAELTYVIIDPPLHGTLSGTAPNLIYRPQADYTGAETFTFKVLADGADSAPAEVAITVETVDDELSGGGVGCSSAGGSAASFSALLLAAVAFCCRRRALRAAAIAVAAAMPGAAEAQGQLPIIEVEALRISASGADGLVSEAGLLLDPGTYRLGFAAHYEYAPLVYSRNGERAGAILKERLTTHFTAAWAPLRWLELSAQLPVVLSQRGDDLTTYGIGTPQSTALGTPVLQLRAASCQQRRGSMFDISSRMGVQLPVGGASALARESGVGLMPQVSVGRAVNGWLRVGGEVGLVLRPDTTFDGSRLERSALETALLVHTTGNGLRGEVSWRGTFSMSGGGRGSELLGGARVSVTRKLEVFGVAGLGLGQPLGTPAFRALVGMAMTFGNEPAAAAGQPVEPE